MIFRKIFWVVNIDCCIVRDGAFALSPSLQFLLFLSLLLPAFPGLPMVKQFDCGFLLGSEFRYRVLLRVRLCFFFFCAAISRSSFFPLYPIRSLIPAIFQMAVVQGQVIFFFFLTKGEPFSGLVPFLPPFSFLKLTLSLSPFFLYHLPFS